MNVNDFGEMLYRTRPTPTPAQYLEDRELAREYLSKHAPDLLDMVLGVDR